MKAVMNEYVLALMESIMCQSIIAFGAVPLDIKYLRKDVYDMILAHAVAMLQNLSFGLLQNALTWMSSTKAS